MCIVIGFFKSYSLNQETKEPSKISAGHVGINRTRENSSVPTIKRKRLRDKALVVSSILNYLIFYPIAIFHINKLMFMALEIKSMNLPLGTQFSLETMIPIRN